MKFPDTLHRSEQYYRAGRILANTAGTIADFNAERVSGPWGEVMSKLAGADDASEHDVAYFEGAAELLEYLGLDTGNEGLVVAANGLLQANRGSIASRDVHEHFVFRQQEAKHSTDLLRYQSPEDIQANEALWQQMGRVSVTGIYLDSFLDAKDDAEKLTQFTRLQLATTAMKLFVISSLGIHPETWAALLKASHDEGLDRHIVKKLLRTHPAVHVSQKIPDLS